MSFLKKRKGFRFLMVDAIRFRWKFYAACKGSTIKVYREVSSKFELKVELPDWIDPWYSISGFFRDDEKNMTLTTDKLNDPAIITPGFVHKLVSFGLKNGWITKLEKMTIQYSDGKFCLISQINST